MRKIILIAVIIELVGSLWAISAAGVLQSLLWLVGTIALGMLAMKRLGLKALELVNLAKQGRPVTKIGGSLQALLGAGLLILPGVVSDIIGASLLLWHWRLWLWLWLDPTARASFSRTDTGQQRRGVVIDGEVERPTRDSEDRP